MKRSHKRQLSRIGAISIVMLGILGSSQLGYQPLSESRDSAILKVITTPSINTYTEGKNGPDGMEYQLIQRFAKLHNLQIEVILSDNTDAIYNALDQGIADIALLGQPVNIAKQTSYHLSPGYRQVSTQLIGRESKTPVDLNKLANKTIAVQDNDNNRLKYKLLKARFGNLEWQFVKASSAELLEQVQSGKIDFTVTDSVTFAMKHPRYPNLEPKLDLFSNETVHLVYSPKSTAILQTAVDQFINSEQANGKMAALIDRFYGHTQDFDNNAYRSFSFLMRNRLPEYQQQFKTVAREFQLDWRLLAAIAYQESHWDPEARSATGVRGFMMLTNETAIDMGVVDRVNLDESLRGGAKYFKKIYRELPKSIQEPDRTWFALAAYNIGIGHLYDAMRLTKINNGNPDTWLDLKQHLPLLAKKESQHLIRYGYARGNEPVEYVQNIRRYYDILAWKFPTFDLKSQNHQIVVRSLDDVIQSNTASTSSGETELHVSGLFF